MRKRRGRKVYIVDGSRTPQLKSRGKVGPFSAGDLAVAAAKPLLFRNNFPLEALDEVILGCMMPGEREANVGRVVALRLGIPQSVPAWTVQRNCASGMQSVDSAYKNIRNGDANLILAGGVEAMSRAPVLFNHTMVNWLGDMMRSRSIGQKISTILKLRGKHLKPVIALIHGLTDDTVGLNMGETAEIIANNFDISRQQMDEYAMTSHHRLAKAQEAGYLDEIEILYDGKGNCYDHDDGVRSDSTTESLGKLRPAFDKKYGKVTAGNSAQITDGASWLLLASEEAVKKYNLHVMASIADTQWAGLDPAVMGMGPVHAMTPIMQRNKLAIDDIDYWEINEAFATQVLGCVQAWQQAEYCKDKLSLKKAMGEIPHEKLNIDGGGVSLGHPVGASGARIILHLCKILQRTDAKLGMASLCIGGGQGGAVLIQNESKNLTDAEAA
ncbi:3-ketoacyl-CoA thiolase @ Acetyl-CoA acetyltransferase [hydrothermal vent metagenome]|uniref:3-ketoacyl-CoA thiolase @ Acetyl-CoA acetyltransferase n=1 Tax=hydrothermal vent metagenome TaxID=652676 RepID=A0A3B0WBH0_9ZZZZ